MVYVYFDWMLFCAYFDGLRLSVYHGFDCLHPYNLSVDDALINDRPIAVE